MAEDKMWNGIGWYGFIGVITTSTTNISLERLFASFKLIPGIKHFSQVIAIYVLVI